MSSLLSNIWQAIERIIFNGRDQVKARFLGQLASSSPGRTRANVSIVSFPKAVRKETTNGFSKKRDYRRPLDYLEQGKLLFTKSEHRGAGLF